MPVYTFYCCRPDDSAPSFEARALASEAAAAEHAQRMLDEHRSCSHVVVCLEDAEVLTARRDQAGHEVAARQGLVVDGSSQPMQGSHSGGGRTHGFQRRNSRAPCHR